MENKNGNGIFLGVVSVATLIVAIIGATFAYFSVSISSNEGAVNLAAYEFNAGISVSQIYPSAATALIPLDPDAGIEGATGSSTTNLLYALNTADTRCVDDNGYQVCALYQVTVTNNASGALTLDGVIRTVSNVAGSRADAVPFADLTYQGVTGELNALQLSGTATTLGADADDTVSIGTITVPGATTDGETTTPGTYSTYVVIYLNENGDQSTQMGATYSGQIVYTSSSGNGSALTGTFVVGNGGNG